MQTRQSVSINTPQSRPRGRRPDRLAFLRRHNALTIAGALCLLLILISTIAAPLLTTKDPTAIDIPARLQPPSLAYPFGTDEFGRGILTRVLYGGRPVLVVSMLSVLAATLLGTTLGMIAGYFGGRVDNVLMRIIDVMLSFPAILLAILIVAVLGTGVANAVIAITFSLIPTFARLARAVAMSLAQDQYVLAAQAIGAHDSRIIIRHVLPNLLPPVIVQATSMLAIAIAYASALSFLGLAVEPPTPDWGLMVSEGQRLIFDAIWVPLFPGLAITLTVLSVNFLGDGLRDQLDPALRNR
jgi:peptide/nickel transport system permease protein